MEHEQILTRTKMWGYLGAEHTGECQEVSRAGRPELRAGEAGAPGNAAPGSKTVPGLPQSGTKETGSQPHGRHGVEPRHPNTSLPEWQGPSLLPCPGTGPRGPKPWTCCCMGRERCGRGTKSHRQSAWDRERIRSFPLSQTVNFTFTALLSS